MSKLVAVVVGLVLALATSGAHAAQALSQAVGKPLQDAQRLAQARNLSGALSAANQAKAAAKSPYEQYMVNEMLAYIYNSSRDYARAADAMDAALRSGQMPAGQQQSRMKAVCTARYQANQLDRAATVCSEYANRYNDAAIKQMVGQIYYSQRNWSRCAQYIRPMVGGGNAQKGLLQMLRRCYFESNDTAGAAWALERLVDQYPSREDWDTLLKTVANNVRGDTRFDLDVLRLRLATGAVQGTSTYMELGQIALQMGVPGDAKRELDQALKAGLIGKGQQASREMRLVNMARQQAAADLAALPRKEAASRAAPQGEADVRVGEALASHGKFAEAIAAIQRGIGKGGAKDPEEAQLRLGLAQVRGGQRDAGLRSLDAAGRGKGNYATIARLWAIHLRNG